MGFHRSKYSPSISYVFSLNPVLTFFQEAFPERTLEAFKQKSYTRFINK